MSRTLLITGFTPFNGLTVNPSYEAVKALPDYVNDLIIYKRLINTSFETSFTELEEAIKELHPDIIINVGVACGRKTVMIEKQAFNERMINGVSEVIIEGSPTVLETTLDYQKITAHVSACPLSLSAGRYVCNYLMYRTLLSTQNTPVKVGFIHVPAMEGMALPQLDTPYMPLEDIIQVLIRVIQEL